MRTVYRHPRFRRLVAAVLMLGVALDATANPTGMTVHNGSATATSSGSQLTVTTTSQNTSLNWQSFNIAPGETTIFQEPSTTAIVWNQINNANPSQIYGSLQANGIVVLLNSSGFYFGPNSFVSAAGLVVSTANCPPPQNSGGSWEFNGPPPVASIVNYGQINIGRGGSAFLIADHVENHGAISAPGGTVGLAAGQTVLLSERPDGRGMSMQVTLPGGSVDNEGRLIADGGTIAMNARVVNQNGFIQANSVQDVNGVIELVASDQLTLGANSQIIASGDNSPAGSTGGNVTLKSGNNFSDSVGSQIITTGGGEGGNGGNVEISAPNVLSLNSSVNARAQSGWTAGKLLLDPDYIILDTSGSGSAGSGTVLAGSNPGSTLDLNVNSAFAKLAVSQIILQAVYDITLAGGTSWNLSETIGSSLGGVTSGQLTLEAGRNIIFGDGSKITDANNWSVALQAGYDFANNTIPSGVGNIYLNGGSGQTGKGSIQLAQGSINLTAGNSIVVGSGCQLIDDGGTIGLNAQTVDQNGLIQADSVANQHGIIELVASDSLTLGANSQIIANGDNSLAGSVGGNVTLQSGNDFSDSVGSQITVTGGTHGGNGGSIEISAPNVLSLNSSMDASAQVGSTAGQLLLNSQDITLNASGANGMNGGTLDLNVNGTFANFSQITLQASGDVTTGSGNMTLAAGNSWNLGAGSVQLTLEAGGDITFGTGSQITDGNNGAATLEAGYNFANNSVQSGMGNIYLNGGVGQTGSGSIQIASGSISLLAGNGIQIGSGTVSSSAGGITWLAGGDITFGTGSQITDGNNGAVTLEAGYNFANNSVQSGAGNIYLNGGSGSIQLSQASLNLTAGNSIVSGSGCQLIDDGGVIGLFAQTVEQDGFIQANSIGTHRGVIELAASGQLTLGAGSQTIANGGEIFASGSTVNQSGLVQADTVQNQSGIIKLTATDTLNLNANSQTVAGGGGVILQAGNNLDLDANSQVVADGGTVFGSATEVSQNGLIQANSVGNQHGVIELVASDNLTLGANSQILAQGDNTASGSAGGNVTLQSGNFSDSIGSQIVTAGGAHGGNGGNVEINAPTMTFNSIINAGAQSGWQSGQLLFFGLADIILGSTGGVVPDGNGTITETTSTGTWYVNVNSAFQNITSGQILLEASGNISIAPNTVWNLTTSTGNRTSGQLTLESGGNIIFGDGSQITDANNWSVTLQAGYSWANNAVQAGVGNIYLNGGSGQAGSGSIQLSQGLNNNLPTINLTAGNSIIVGSGFVITTGGGSISAHALAGNIDTGSFAIGYYFETALSAGTPVNQAYDFSDGLGGISTEAGGNVSLTAGGNVTSVLPGANGYYYDGTHYGPVSADQNVDYATAGSGAYGNQPGQSGSVTIVAGGDVTGHYLVANGVGSIFAGVKMDANGNPVTDSSGNYVLGISGSAGGTDTSNPSLALSLISGGWNVSAAQDILLQEVRNPNGVFDYAGGAAYDHYFDYSSGDYVNLTAGNLVQLGASPSVLPRLTSLDSINVPFIYPSILNISAGAGGVQLAGGNAPFNQLILFPSPQGSLTINTTDGGSLVGDLPTASDGTPQIFNLIVSDSGHLQYRSGFFGLNDHAATPVHLDNPTPIVLNISGDMSLVFLGVPEAAQITVGGNMDNCGFQGMNLSANDVTSINVTGDINNRSAFTSVDLSQVSGEQAPLLSYLVQAVTGPGDPLATTLATSFYYNPTTQILTYQNIPGQNLAGVLQLLQNLTVQVYKNGVPQWTDPNDTIPLTTTVSVLNAADAQALLAQYNALGGIPSGASGYILGGGGAFDISARNMDLGTSVGIQSKGVGLYKVGSSYPLANSPPQGAGITQGADINVNVTGNLDMYSSSIASLNGGNIYINAGGDINAGSADFTITALGARGIYTTDLGNVYVYANGDINVNGSRIAVYDTRQDNSSGTAGGSVTVVSRNGNIDAGNGGSGFVVVSSYQVGPDQSVTAFSSTIPGSGIMQVSYTQPGNMLVEAPNGTVNAGAGGIPQLLLTGSPLPESTALFDLPLNLEALAGIFDLELTGNMKTALALQTALNGIPGNSQVNVYAGYELQELADSLTTAEVLAGDELQNLPGLPAGLLAVVDRHGNPIVNANNLSDGTLVKISDNQNITATGSGVLGAGSVTLEASGNITGTIFAFNNVNVNAANNIDVNVLGLGNVNVNSSGGGTVSGTIIGVGGVSASGGSIDANLESNSTISGNTSGQSGLAPGTAANAASQGMASENSASPAKNDDTTATDDDLKKKGKAAATVRKAGRVTVILPPRQQSKAQTPEPRT